jgi:uncharacterized membrane protein YqjE
MTEEAAADHGTEHNAQPGHAGYTGVFRGLFDSVIEAARTRLDLAAVEAEIFVLRTLRMLLWALAALACALLALVFAVVAVVAALWDTHRMLGLLSGVGLFVVLAAVFGYVASHTFKGRPAMLEGTLQQLETDQRRVSGKP